MFLDFFALGMLFFVGLTLFYGIIAIHDIPYEISKHRNHPHQDAIHVAGWVSLFTLHVLWPFLWIWATLYREERGWGFQQLQEKEQQLEQDEQQLASREQELSEEVAKLKRQVAIISKHVQQLEQGEDKQWIYY